MTFSEQYAQLRTLGAAYAREDEPIREEVVCCVWYDQLYQQDGLSTDDGRSIEVVSPGWWNKGEGPDFKGAEVRIAGRLKTGDIEIHLDHRGWRQHGHDLDSRYDEVLLVVSLEREPPGRPPRNSLGRAVPSLLLGNFLEADIRDLADRLAFDDYPYGVAQAAGRCSALVEAQGPAQLEKLLMLAGEWRMLNKARTLRQRMETAGPEQALYEAFLSACGYSHFKHHFAAIARHLPYDRARQLARQDGLLLEAALLSMAGLLPDALPEGTAAAHFARLRSLRREHLRGLKPLPLTWRRVGVRPNNYPERRLAGAARFLARTARDGLLDTLNHIWRMDLAAVARRRAFEELFPKPMGFWSVHCSWTGKKLARPVALLGAQRVRSIIGNVFVAGALAIARARRDRDLEDRVFAFFSALPKEAGNEVVRAMLPRLFGQAPRPKLDFRLQQGILQMHQDWCRPNPSCERCSVMGYLGLDGAQRQK